MRIVLSQEEFEHQRGYRFTLEIRDAHGGAMVRSTQNWLPPAPELIQHCHHCRGLSHELHRMRSRLRLEKLDDSEAENPIPSDDEVLQQQQEEHARAIEQRNNDVNNWLNSESFRNVKQTILDRSMEQEDIVILIRTDSELQILPWAAWDLTERRPRLEFARLPLENQ
ncbi:MAG: hypothetical protein F6K14_28395 [Symploca sp. SIO2C1]|nr:hypothetical protein [Symploca sp. SIO2C1]